MHCNASYCIPDSLWYCWWPGVVDFPCTAAIRTGGMYSQLACFDDQKNQKNHVYSHRIHVWYTYMYHKNELNVGTYTSPMDPSWDSSLISGCQPDLETSRFPDSRFCVFLRMPSWRNCLHAYLLFKVRWILGWPDSHACIGCIGD